MNTASAALTTDPRECWMGPDPSGPRLWPDELRTKTQPQIHEAEPAWARVPPANAHQALAAIAKKVFNAQDLLAIEQLEDSIGAAAADRKKYCDPARYDQQLWELNQDPNVLPNEFAERARAIEDARQGIRAWTMACDRAEEAAKQKLRPFALRVAQELPGFIARAINEILEKPDQPTGDFWGINSHLSPQIRVLPLLRLHSIAKDWLASLEANTEDGKHRIRAILMDAGVLKPRVFVFRPQY